MNRTMLTAGAALAMATVGLGVSADSASASTSWGNAEISHRRVSTMRPHAKLPPSPP